MHRAMDGVPVQVMPLPGGDTGTRKTIAEMRRLADEGSRSPAVRVAVLSAIRSRSVSPHDVGGQITAWFEYVRDQLYFLHDPRRGEWLQAPAYTLRFGAGDCDDRATLLAAGLMAFGVQPRFKVVAADPRFPETMSHVYVEVPIGGKWIALDPTYRRNGLGDEPPRYFRSWEIPL